MYLLAIILREDLFSNSSMTAHFTAFDIFARSIGLKISIRTLIINRHFFVRYVQSSNITKGFFIAHDAKLHHHTGPNAS